MLRGKGMILPAHDNSEQEQEGPGNTPVRRLTSIHPAYTLAATNEHGTNEVDELIVRHFIEILAEVALAVASRKVGETKR